MVCLPPLQDGNGKLGTATWQEAVGHKRWKAKSLAPKRLRSHRCAQSLSLVRTAYTFS